MKAILILILAASLQLSAQTPTNGKKSSDTTTYRQADKHQNYQDKNSKPRTNDGSTKGSNDHSRNTRGQTKDMSGKDSNKIGSTPK
ncbi:MAG TPA: hypothetical protein VFF27_07425 [Bacteroidia bacterium]|jgi:hypothetical protein|nr:hypothetical protein [Bacteroidia bacterium]